MGNTQEHDGSIDQANGKVEQAVAAVASDERLKTEGQIDEAAGHVEDAVGRTRRKAGKAIEQIARTVKP